MGGWKLEIAKMALYVSFPVAMFHYFNQPELFEDWVVKKKQELYPPETKEKREEFQAAIRRIQEKQDERIAAAMEQRESQPS